MSAKQRHPPSSRSSSGLRLGAALTVFAVGAIVAITGAIQVFDTARSNDPTGPIITTSPPTSPSRSLANTVTVTIEVTVTEPGYAPDEPTGEQPGTRTIAVASDMGGSGPAVISMAGGVLVALIGGAASIWAARTQRQPQPPPWVMIPPQYNWTPPPAGTGWTPPPQPFGYPLKAPGPTQPAGNTPARTDGPPVGHGVGDADHRGQSN